MDVVGGGDNVLSESLPRFCTNHVATSEPVIVSIAPVPVSHGPKQARHRLSQYHTFDDAVELLKKSSKIIVLTGAGISTSLGIPDFRSDSGLFTQLKKHGYSDPEDLFHIDNFRLDPDSFFKVVKSIVPPDSDNAGSRFSPTHAFIKLLDDRGKLQTNYTQNIDGLEAAASVPEAKVIQCHGSFATATCQSCGRTISAKRYLPVVRRGITPKHPSCWGSRSSTPGSDAKKPSPKGKYQKRKRDWDDESDDDESETRADTAIFKPDIVFYGEKVASSFWPRFDEDKKVADLILVIGTSLQVAPVKDILSRISENVPQIYISKSRCVGAYPDIELLGDSDVIVHELARRVGWSLKHEMLPADEDANTVKIEEVEGSSHQYLVRRLNIK